MVAQRHFRTVWLSDIHLGYKDCKAEYLLDFLKNHTIETLYLVGDIVDMWAMRKQFLWPESHNSLFHTLLSLPKQGTKVIYLPGNHDEPVQKYVGMTFVDIEIHREYIHETVQGERLLILHGDQFDQEVCFGALQSWLGARAYGLLLFINRWYNHCRGACGLPYWSFAGYIKSRVKGATKAIDRFKQSCCKRAESLNLDGVVCGHIHHPEIDTIQGIQYCNDGDWIENCSALTENHKGELSLVYWPFIQADNLYPIKDKDSVTPVKAA